MRILKIQQNDNGSHNNQQGNFTHVPEGYAVIPDNMELEHFPFGEVIAEEIDGVMTVTAWTPGVIPEPEPPVYEPTETEQLRADVDYLAIMTGVEL